MSKLQQLVECYHLINQIDRLLDKLDKVDPYGDLVENFADFPDKYPPVTKRLLKMLNKDIIKEEVK